MMFAIISCILLVFQTVLFAQESSYHMYLPEEEVIGGSVLDAEAYKLCVEALPICCVDAFVYRPSDRCYLLIKRNAPPLEGEWWYPGGRLLKGESFYEAAVRKSQVESGLKVQAIAQLGTYSTLFANSAWDCQTHTVNTAVLVFAHEDQSCLLDQNHDAFSWRPLDEVPQDPYLRDVYLEAKELIGQ